MNAAGKITRTAPQVRPLSLTRWSFGKAVAPYLFLAPAMLVFLAFSYFPFIKTIYLSTTITNAAGQVKKFVGLDNYIDMFTSSATFDMLKTTFRFVPMIVIPSILLGLVLALLAERKLGKLSPVYEVMFSLPIAIASASAAIIWSMLFNPLSGALNYLLGTNINWLTDKNYALTSVAIVTVWMQLGTNFIFLLTGLRGVPEELNESAMIDGAGFFQRFIKIKLPMISPTLFFVVFMNMMSSFQAFGQIRLLTNGGPGTSTQVWVYGIYLEAFMNYRFGSASAMSILLFIIMLSVALIQFKFENKGVHYS